MIELGGKRVSWSYILGQIILSNEYLKNSNNMSKFLLS
ncbi:hypothetical protein SPLC1_S420370 [Arthrospira platensis C1]|nr:hypothetical protein SPLC1_S420370 [Arthrospira platensis C1]